MNQALIDVVRETVSLWLVASAVLSMASVWALVQATRARRGRDRA